MGVEGVELMTVNVFGYEKYSLILFLNIDIKTPNRLYITSSIILID